MDNSLTPQILQRIRSEYIEMPGLTLRPEQVQRLCGVEHALCQSVLDSLVESGFLSRRPDGAYGRVRDSEIVRARQARAGLEPVPVTPLVRARQRAS